MSTDYRFGDAELRPSQRKLLVGGKEKRIGARAFDLLLALVEHRDRIVAKNELLDSVWSGLVVEENNLQVHISSLRKLLGPQAIATVPGHGYRFTAPLEGEAAAAAAEPEHGAAHREPWAPALSNLPAELPPLYGRARDLPALRQLLERHRLVTIVGPSGIGKTQLAQALAGQLRESFGDGVWVVELAPVTDPSFVAATMARVLRVTLAAGAPVDTLASVLRGKEMLIVLDNCEHVARDVAALADALHGAAPRVRLVATSQEPLRLAREQVYRLGALELPQDDDLDNVRRAGAVALLEARARAVDPGFVIDAGNAEAVVDICRRLDGIPLAIELAAARLPLLGVEGLRARLGERFRVLTGGSRLAMPRHQTLRAALEWSHGLLAPQEQTVFRRLGVFAGTFGLDSAQRVAGDGDVDHWMVLEHLGALVDKSLVAAEPGISPRYRLLETTRAFALEKLAQAGEADEVMRNHAEAMLAVFEESHRNEYLLPRQARMDRYLPDLDNARAALEWAAGPQGDSRLLIALTGAMGWLWDLLDIWPEGQRRGQLARARIDASTPPHLEARLVNSWPCMAMPETRAEALAGYERAIALYRQLGDRQGLFGALCAKTIGLVTTFDPAGAEATLREAEQVFDAQWPPGARARLLMARFWVLNDLQRFDDALCACQELHRLAIAFDDKRVALSALVNMEQAAAMLGRMHESVARGRELLELMQRDPALRTGNEACVLGNLCMALTEVGEIGEAFEIAQRVHALRGVAGNASLVLDAFARLAFKRGHIENAARMIGRSDTHYATRRFKRQLVECRVRDALMAELQAALPARELARLIQEGELLSDEEAARLVLRG